MSESLAEALAAFQADLPHIAKNDRADVGTYSYSYAGLPDVTAAVMPRLAGHGLSFVAKPTMDDGRFVLAYSLLHVSGEREDGSYPLPSNGTPQAIGSAITYARRYTLAAVTGVVPNDDDDGAAAERERSRPQRQEVEHLTDRQVAALDEIAQQLPEDHPKRVKFGQGMPWPKYRYEELLDGLTEAVRQQAEGSDDA